MCSRLLEKGRKFQLVDINLVVTGSRGMVTRPSPGGYVHAIAFAFMLHVAAYTLTKIGCYRNTFRGIWLNVPV